MCESTMEMAGEPDYCQTPVQNVTEDLSVHVSMLWQLCLQETCTEELLKGQDGAEECPTIDLHLPKCTDFYNCSC